MFSAILAEVGKEDEEKYVIRDIKRIIGANRIDLSHCCQYNCKK